MLSRSLLVSVLAGLAQAAPRPDLESFTASHPGFTTTGVYEPPQPSVTFHRPANGTSTLIAFVPTESAVSPNSTASVTKDACASVSAASASYKAATPSATARVPAKLAYDCLNSIPFNQSAAEALVLALRPYVEWQSTIEYIKSPPAEYAAKIQPPYDFYAAFDKIQSKVFSGSYKNEYEFGFDLYRAYQRTHDGHFVFYPDSVVGVFTFGRTTPLVSVSQDGHKIPKIYAYSDVLAASYSKTTASRISPVTQIDGQDVVQYLLDWSQNGSLQDRDALWNNVFYSPPQVALGSSGSGVGTFAGAGRGRYIYPGDYTTITFANGTTIKNENFANVLLNFNGINNGGDIYRTHFAQPEESYYNVFDFNPFEPSKHGPVTTSTSAASTSTQAASTSTSAAKATPNPGYPSPVVANPQNLNSGYFLNGKGYNDVAVLALNSFAANDQFQDVNSELIAAAVKANKTKLIIDVSANGGGTILQGYDVFKQLFPSILPFQLQRLRALEAVDILGKQSSYIGSMLPRSLDNNDTIVEIQDSIYDYHKDLNADYKPFTSWKEKFGPHAAGPAGDLFTSLFRWNLTDEYILYDGGIEISGYGNRSNVTMQPFKAENIIIITDGYCASTCTIFHELMATQGGVKVISLGGRPNLDITQAIGGVKGTNDIGYDSITYDIQNVYSISNESTQDSFRHSVLANYTFLPQTRGTVQNVNLRDGIRKNDASQTPTQFIYEPADCRILYTPEMVIDETAVWKTVADTVWNGKSACVAGSNNFYNTTSSAAKRSERLVTRNEVRKDFDYQAAVDSLDFRGAKVGSGDGYMPL